MGGSNKLTFGLPKIHKKAPKKKKNVASCIALTTFSAAAVIEYGFSVIFAMLFIFSAFG